jgi:hypothetical protein
MNSPQERSGLSDAPQPRWRTLLAQHGLLNVLDNVVLPTAPLNLNKAVYIAHCLSALTEADQLIELRVIGVQGRKRVDSGYFDHVDKLAKAALSYDGKAEGLYFTLNPVNPTLLARANNRVKEYAQHTTSDSDVIKRINLPIDFDPVRPAGVSATDAEHRSALQRAWACATWLTSQGWPEPVFADSGNGAHLIYAIDMPNDAASTERVKQCLEALAYLFSDEAVKVDASTSNAARIFKLYGTTACKGDSTADRPHRRSAILSAPDRKQIVTHEQLELLAGLLHHDEPMAQKSRSESHSASAAYGQVALKQELLRLSNVQAGHRNNQLFQSSAALFSLVASGLLSSPEVWSALTLTAQKIGLSEIEAERTIRSGEKRGLASPRTIPDREDNSQNTTPKVDKPAQPFLAATANSEHKVIDAAQRFLMHVDKLDSLPPISWLIQDVLPSNSLAEIHGAPAVGKTQVIFDMAQTLAATGKTVIYVVAEGLQGYRARKRAWQKFRNTQAGNLFIWQGAVQLFEKQAVQTFIEAIKLQQPALVVFDTLSRCSLGADENNQKDMGFILDSLDQVRRETGATVAVVHHTNASGLRERGSSVIRGGMDVMIEVSRDDDLILVSCSKMKDAEDFATIYLKPVLVDIDEERPVPVLIPAERRVQTQADKLTALQLDILKAVGMEMFAESGIKSNQLDEILPPSTKRASKYHSLNTLIRLGYIKPHQKGDPYQITEAGREKLSNAESGTVPSKSNVSKGSLTLSIWTLPDSCPMSNPNPHTCGCGLDETLDNTIPETTQTQIPEARLSVETTPEEPSAVGNTTDNILEAYLQPGLVTTEALYHAYKAACDVGQGTQFRLALQERSEAAYELLSQWVRGNRPKTAIAITRRILRE